MFVTTLDMKNVIDCGVALWESSQTHYLKVVLFRKMSL